MKKKFYDAGVYFSAASVNTYQTIRRGIPRDSYSHRHRREDIKYNLIVN